MFLFGCEIYMTELITYVLFIKCSLIYDNFSHFPNYVLLYTYNYLKFKYTQRLLRIFFFVTINCLDTNFKNKTVLSKMSVLFSTCTVQNSLQSQ